MGEIVDNVDLIKTSNWRLERIKSLTENLNMAYALFERYDKGKQKDDARKLLVKALEEYTVFLKYIVDDCEWMLVGHKRKTLDTEIFSKCLLCLTCKKEKEDIRCKFYSKYFNKIDGTEDCPYYINYLDSIRRTEY